MLASCGGGLGLIYRKYAAFVADLLLTVSSSWSLIERRFALTSVRPACSCRLIVPDILASWRFAVAGVMNVRYTTASFLEGVMLLLFCVPS